MLLFLKAYTTIPCSIRTMSEGTVSKNPNEWLVHNNVVILSNHLLVIRLTHFYKRFSSLQDLVKNLMQMLSVSPVPIQHDIITSLPEILEDSQQNEVARELRYS